jgi:preprotein translocase subunit SecD
MRREQRGICGTDDRIKRLLGSTAKMTFRLLAPEGAQADAETELLPYSERGHGAERIAVRRHIEVDGANLTKASAGQDSRTGEWVVHFGLDRIGAKRFADVSTRHVGEPFAIVLDGKVISAPVIREPIIGGQGKSAAISPSRTPMTLPCCCGPARCRLR